MKARTCKMLLRGLVSGVGVLVVASIAIGAAAQDQVPAPAPTPVLGDALATSVGLAPQSTPLNEKGVYAGSCGYFVEVDDTAKGYCIDGLVDHDKDPLSAWVLAERLRGHDPTAAEQEIMAEVIPLELKDDLTKAESEKLIALLTQLEEQSARG